jgi:hypothetical protein
MTRGQTSVWRWGCPQAGAQDACPALAIAMDRSRYPAAVPLRVQSLGCPGPGGTGRGYAQAIQLAGDPARGLAVREPLEDPPHRLRPLGVNLPLTAGGIPCSDVPVRPAAARHALPTLAL